MRSGAFWARLAKKAGIKIYMITTDIFEADDKFAEPILKTASSLGIKYYRMGWRYYNEKKTVTQNLEDFKTKVGNSFTTDCLKNVGKLKTN